jgi:CRISPR system Cascade subunit CasE
MYLSCLLIDTGSNPDRPRPGRLWLRNHYHVHQRLCMAFPSAERKSDDEHFLKPFKPDDFARGQVHVSRGRDTGSLFRVDPQSDGRAVIIVQSAQEPDWEYAFHNAGYLLAAPPEVKSLELVYAEGQRLQFRLLANPTRRLSKNSLGADGQPIDAKDIGKRVPVRDEQLIDWLTRQGKSSGFATNEDDVLFQTGFIYFGKGQNGDGQRLRSVRYDGVLTVTDPEKLRAAVAKGIGSGKAFGFGLLSIAPVR